MPQLTAPTVEHLTRLLEGVIDPELGSNIVELGMVSDVVFDDGRVTITVALTTLGCPLRSQIKKDVVARIENLPGVDSVKVEWGELDQDGKAAAMRIARQKIAENPPDNEIPPTTKIVMIASGKGGVGKSSVTVNLAAALAARGHTVGVMDADIWGFSVPRMLGIDGRLAGATDAKKIVPNVKPVGKGQLKVVSMGFLVEQEETALMWRGLILSRAVQHFLEDVLWGPMDYLLIDMPPGTGDVQMGLAKRLPRAEMIVVTTPARSAHKVAVRAANMGRNNYLRVAGVIENMSVYVAPDGSEHKIFGEGGGEQLAADIGVPLLGKIPIDGAVARGGDNGEPVALGDGPAADAFNAVVDQLVAEIVPPVEMASCTARLYETAVALP